MTALFFHEIDLLIDALSNFLAGPPSVLPWLWKPVEFIAHNVSRNHPSSLHMVVVEMAVFT